MMLSLPFALLSLMPVLGTPADSLELFRRWRNSPTPDLRMQAARSLRNVPGSEARAALLSLLEDSLPAVRCVVRASKGGSRGAVSYLLNKYSPCTGASYWPRPLVVA